MIIGGSPVDVTLGLLGCRAQKILPMGRKGWLLATAIFDPLRV